MDGGADDEWEDASFLDELFRATDEAVASRNPNPTPSPTPASHDPFAAAAPISYLPAASAPISYLPAASASASTSVSYLPAASASVSYLPAASYSSPALRFSPPRELTQRSPLPRPSAASSDAEAMAMVDRGFSPPRELSQRPAAEETNCAIVAASGPAGSGMGAKRERETREVERLKRELSRVSKQVNDLKNECTELRKDRSKKDLQIKAKEAEIQNLKKANVCFASKDVCNTGMDIDQPFHAPANGALHDGNSSWASTRRTDKTNGKDNDAHFLRDDLGHPPDALELRRHTMIDNGVSTSGGMSLEENTLFETRNNMCKEIKAIGVQTDSTFDGEHLERKKVLVERISSNLRAISAMPANSLSRRNLISKIIVSCSEEILSLPQCTKLIDNCETPSEASSSMNEAISEVYNMFIKMNNEKIPIQTFLEALVNLCAFDNVRSKTAAIVGRTLRILLSIMQHLLSYGTKSRERNNVSVEPYVNILMEDNHKDNSSLLSPLDAENLLRQHNMSLPFAFWSSVFTVMLQLVVKYSEETIRTDALSIMILIVRTTDPEEERYRFGFTSVMTKLHLLLQKENGLLVKKHSVRLLFLLLNCPVMLKVLCSGGKDGSEQMELEGCENDRSQVISSVLVDLSECLSSKATCSLEIELCRIVIVLLAYIASSGKLGYEVLLGPVSARGANFLELIMEVLALQMQYETQELLKERCLLMREALILLNRLASHANFSKPTLEVLTSSKRCATLTVDVANRLSQTQMASDLAELAQKFRSRVYAFLEEKPLQLMAPI